MKKLTKKQKGFTIIELMMATAVFSLVLILCMAAIMQITRLYYRGVTQANTQEVARAIVDELSQSIQFSNSEIYYPTGMNANPTGPDIATTADPIGFFCIGSQRYTYQLDRQLIFNNPVASVRQVSNALWVDSPKADDGSPLGCAESLAAQALDLTDENAVNASDGTELLDENMRLTKLNIEPAVSGSEDIWSIEVTVVYGDDDLLELDDNNTTDTADDRKKCQPSGPGIEFCAVSEISTTVRRRVE